jgi:hypothetical protein
MDNLSDLKIDVKLNQLDIVVNIPLIQKIISFFTIPSNLNIKNFQNVAYEKLINSTTSTNTINFII